MDPRDVALQQVLGPEEADSLLTLSELADRAGVSLTILEAIEREGLLIPRVDAPQPLYHPDDAETVRAGLDLISAGLPLGELLDLARRANESMRPLAEAAVDAFVRFVSDPVEGSASTDEDVAARLVDAFEKMLPAVRSLIGHHFQRLLIDDARRRLS